MNYKSTFFDNDHATPITHIVSTQSLVEVADLSAQFYFKESDVGKPRSAACASQLSELNNYVNVTVGSGKDCLSDMSKYACVLGDSNYVTVIKLIVIFIKRLPYDIYRPYPRF